MVFMMIYIWFRATFPRFRFDQLMDLGWKWMIPLALGNIFVTALVILGFGSRTYDGALVWPGEIVLSVAGAILLGLTVFHITRKPAPRPSRPTKVMNASRVSEA
jgi:hypothetical protein